MNEEQVHEQSKESTHHEDSMRQAILKSIQSGSVSRKPKWQFILQTILTTIGVFLVLLAAVYLASAVFFALRVNGAWALPTLGFAGVPGFLRSVPWVFLILSLIFAGLLYALVKRYAFAYGRPLLYSALGVVIVVSASAVLVGFTSFHQGVFQMVHDGHVPFSGSPLYENFGHQPHDVTIGTITAMSPNSWTIQTRQDGSYKIAINPNIPTPMGAAVGDEVVVLGMRHDKTIDAEAIRPLRHSNGGQPIDPGGPMIPAPQQPNAQPTY